MMTKITYPDAKEKPLLELCSAELGGATETSVLDGGPEKLSRKFEMLVHKTHDW